MVIELRENNTLKETYWVRLRAKNGKILMSSEVYASKSNAERAAKQLCRSLKLPYVFTSTANPEA